MRVYERSRPEATGEYHHLKQRLVILPPLHRGKNLHLRPEPTLPQNYVTRG